MNYNIIKKYEHYEVYVDGKFYCSADTVMEAVQEIENNYQVKEVNIYEEKIFN